MSNGRAWPIAMSAVLALVVVANIAVAIIANDDPSFAIEPDYYARAVAWDSTLAQARRDSALHWTVRPTLAPFSRDGAVLRVDVRDADGAPVDDATVTVSAVYNARASLVHNATLERDSLRAYVATLPVSHAGLWELQFVVTRGADRFTARTRVEAYPSAQ